uniref:Uncharacterized protein n=1 Tax=Populus trichocarpa x Populus deltoides TaxID=3695 RepID=A9PK51_9ROSI|nr:unknown [Populus trichocarpa x Populus deltoides]
MILEWDIAGLREGFAAHPTVARKIMSIQERLFLGKDIQEIRAKEIEGL